MTDKRHTEVLVMGGGIIGLATAYYLNRAGRKVHLIEKETVGGDAAASYGNCGLLFFSDLPPLCQPGAVADALVRMTRRTSPLYIKPELDLPKLMWLLKFAANCNPAHFKRAVVARHDLFSRSGSSMKLYSRTRRWPASGNDKGSCWSLKSGHCCANTNASMRCCDPMALPPPGCREPRCCKKSPPWRTMSAGPGIILWTAI
jgi:choline dehydrogenase-like flavoprotein